MKLLVFEYVIGGGLCQDEIPNSLAAEGLLMLNALLRDCSELSELEITLMLDTRFALEVTIPGNCKHVIQVNQDDNALNVLEFWMQHCDAIWPVAPEIDGILLAITRLAEKHAKILLTSGSEAVALTTDKLKTVQHLTSHNIRCVPTKILALDYYPSGTQVVKPLDGMGCEQTYLIENAQDWEAIKSDLSPKRNYVVQPFITGQPKSLSCIFKDGQGWIICLKLSACIVNQFQLGEQYQLLVDSIAQALPELWGYVGIDFIETDNNIRVLEINPRLTTSYAGINQATGLNVVQQVWLMLVQEPSIVKSKDQTVEVSVSGIIANAN
jgi:tyramine---L-glutamate ligase